MPPFHRGKECTRRLWLFNDRDKYKCADVVEFQNSKTVKHLTQAGVSTPFQAPATRIYFIFQCLAMGNIVNCFLHNLGVQNELYLSHNRKRRA